MKALEIAKITKTRLSDIRRYSDQLAWRKVLRNVKKLSEKRKWTKEDFPDIFSN